MSSLDNALDVIALLSRDRPVLRVGEVGRETGLPRSSVSRLLQAMGRAALLEREPGGGYVAGPLSLRLAELYRARHSLLEQIDGALGRLVAEFGFTGFAASLVGTEIVLLRVKQGAYPLRYVREIGARLPAASTVMGRALLARVGDTGARARRGGLGRSDAGDGADSQTASGASGGGACLQPRLEEIACTRVAIAPSEFAEGITTIGCAFASDGESPMAMALAFPESAVDSTWREVMLVAVRREAAEIGRRAGDPRWAEG